MARKSSKGTGESLAVGGQAVIEGVMMRNKHKIATAVRNPKGKIEIKKDEFHSLTVKNKFFGLPFVRGSVNLIEIMIIGMKSMIWSSRASLEEDEDFSTAELVGTIAFSIIFSLALFKLLPLFFATVFQNNVGSGNFLFNLIDGLTKIALLVGYIWLISFMNDVKRLFGYHGAEHKTIHCHEKGLKLTTANVLKQSRLHPRCGTTFILFVFFMSVLFYMVIPLNVSFWAKFFLRILLLPIIAGFSYELIKLGGKYHENPIMKCILFPGMMLQKLTTNEPTKDQAEVAIKSLKAVL